MHNIEVTMEKSSRIAKSFEVTDSVYEEIERTGKIPDDMFDEMKGELADPIYVIEYDYAVYDEDKDKQLIDWE